jgi:hypothetical protein
MDLATGFMNCHRGKWLCFNSYGCFWLYRLHHLIMLECYIIHAIINSDKEWHRMVKHKFVTSEHHYMHDFQSFLTVSYNPFPWWGRGLPFTFLHCGSDWMNTSINLSSIKAWYRNTFSTFCLCWKWVTCNNA